MHEYWTYLIMDSLSGAITLKKADFYSLSADINFLTPQIGVGLWGYLLNLWSVRLDLSLVLSIKSQLFWAHKCNYAVLSRKYCLSVVIHQSHCLSVVIHLWILWLFYLIIQNDTWVLWGQYIDQHLELSLRQWQM